MERINLQKREAYDQNQTFLLQASLISSSTLFYVCPRSIVAQNTETAYF